jgi:hypothetical protein
VGGQLDGIELEIVEPDEEGSVAVFDFVREIVHNKP